MTRLASTPLKSGIARDRILNWIRAGRIDPGERLCSERELAQMLSMSTRTVRRGLAELVAEGVIEKRPRSGNFVRGAKPREAIQTIAMALPTYLREGRGHHPTVGALLTGAGHVFDQRSYALTTYWYRPGHFWLDAGQVIAESQAPGLLLYPHGSLVRPDIDRLLAADVKLALLARPSCAFFEDIRVGGAQIDRVSALAQVMDRLLAAGHRRIAVGCYTAISEGDRIEATLLAYRQRYPDLAPMRDLAFDIPNERFVDLGILPLVLDRRPRPTALLLPDEVVASEAFRLCYQRGLRVPEDISLASVIDSTPHAYPVALVATDASRLMVQTGERAADYLKRLIDGEAVDHASINIPCEVEDGDSIGPPPGEA